VAEKNGAQNKYFFSGSEMIPVLLPSAPFILRSQPGLPDGLFSNQKSKFG
jgi:hypothetical protein